jgi:hypothetical protein
MSQDLLSILTGSPAGKTSISPAGTPAIQYDPVEAAMRTVYAENPRATPEERKAIASVIANRAKASGKTVGEVVQEAGQFEPWATESGRKRIDGLKAGSSEYTALLQDVGPILTGDTAPTTEATFFYAPKAQKQLAETVGDRPAKPAWDDGSGTQIGDHLFIARPYGKNDLATVLTGSPAGPDAGKAQADEAFNAMFGDPAKYGEDAQQIGARFEDHKTFSNAAQKKTLDMMGEGYRPKDPAGSERHPYFLPPGSSAKDVPPGAFFVDFDGKMKRAEGGEKLSSPFKGLGQGVGDVAISVGGLVPGLKDSELMNLMKTDQAAYGAGYGGDPASGLGRFTGQVVGSMPAMMGAEAAAAPLLGRAGQVGAFLAGKAGQAALPETAGATARLAQMATRGSSLAASGAGEGVLASGLVSSANQDTPIGEQLATGAVLGGALKPVGSLVAKGMERFVGPRLQGAIDPAEQALAAKTAGELPVPVPMSLGNLTGAPAQQMLENSLLRGAEGDIAAGVMQAFKGEQQGALRGNVEAVAAKMGGKPVAAGEAGKAVSERLNTMRDAANDEINAAYKAAREQGENAMLASAKDARNSILEGLRSEYELDRIKGVANVVESFGEGGAPTAREIYDMRTKLSNLTQSSDSVEGGAARKAVRALDSYIDGVVREDLLIGDPNAVKAWKEAIGKRAAFGKLFEGDDMIEALTERVQRGGGTTLKVDPEEATNYILNRSSLGFIGKRNLGRDLKRLEKVLGKDSDEWNALRAETFMRIARAGEGAPEGGVPQFSGQNFMKAWERVKKEDPNVLGVMFTPEERALVDQFAEVAQKVTTPVKGGDNPSNSAITGKKLLEPIFQFLAIGGGAGGGAAMGGIPGAAAGAAMGSFMKQLKEILSAGKARRITYGAKPMAEEALRNPLLPGSMVPTTGAVAGNSLAGTQPKQ